MPRRLIKRFLPRSSELHDHPLLQLFGCLLHNPDLWYFNRNSVAGAVSVGLFVAFVPLPFQMVLAAAAAMALGCNLPIAIVMVWVTNPLTMAPIFFAAYKLGAWLLNETTHATHFQVSFTWLFATIGANWKPLLLGGFILGVFSAAIGNIVVRVFWRVLVVRKWRARQARRLRQDSMA